jgi:AmmeMemoRadiSam system radical SAM enzyme/AmmeMemoRadiSam system protein B/uncharacterized protein (TIGR00296 family)
MLLAGKLFQELGDFSYKRFALMKETASLKLRTAKLCLIVGSESKTEIHLSFGCPDSCKDSMDSKSHSEPVAFRRSHSARECRDSNFSGLVAGEWWHPADDGRIACDLCPRDCRLKPGDRGFCFVRQNVDGQMKLTTYGRSTGFCIDPIEKKPLNHFLPGTPVLSFGTAGCNLGCKFCQNWDISKSREVERLSELAMPDSIAVAALKTDCRSVAFTYNDPIIWAEYAIDTAHECRRLGIHPVAVTAGYISPAARAEFFHAMDAANVDLKAFTEDFYERITYSKLQPVLDTLHWLKHESDVWFEITNLIIADTNDSPDELRRMCDWILQAVGAEVPVHFSAFHPDFRMMDQPRTPHETLVMARDIAIRQGLKFVYVGNVNDVFNQSTWCPGCGELLIERNWYQLGQWNLDGNSCRKCGTSIPGRFDKAPGTWGNRRQPIRISDYASPHAKSTSHSNATSTDLAVAPTVKNDPPMNTLKTAPEISSTQQQALQLAACEIVAAAVNGSAPQLSDPSLGGLADLEVMGVFVTLKKSGQLRGCVGMLGEPMTIRPALLQAGHRTAVADQRFPPVAAHELPQLTLDVTILFNFETIHEIGEARTNAVEVGKHGLKIIHAGRSGLLLPIVAVEHQWDARTFLEQVCRKAGLPSNAWLQPDSQLLRFEGRLIEGPFSAAVAERAIQSSAPPRSTLPSQDYVRSLATFVTANIRSLTQGAIPACFPAYLSDRTVDGLAIQLILPNGQQITFSRLQPNGGVPLQMTLLELAQSAASWLQQTKNASSLVSQISADVLLLFNAEQLKSVNSETLSRMNPGETLLLLTDGNKTAWRFHRNTPLPQTLQQLFQDVSLSDPNQAGLFRFAACCSCDNVTFSSRPQPQKGTALRKAAVAGKFYPSSPKALAGLINSCLGTIPDEKERWPAVMVPHAGLQYSGRIAGQVFRRIHIPESVIIIGPRHTRNGVDLAVAPNAEWELPGQSITSDVALAQVIVAGVPALQFDAAAHAAEHSIEVELPFLARLAPQARVVGITIGSASLEQCLTIGHQLAAVIRTLPVQPLLVVSSDMNHFATDAENRRLDELALKAMETMSPAKLYETVRSQNISMCGVLPAVIVMTALESLGQLKQAVRTGYSTSAETSGDTSRVVGYAGMLLGP